jgi:hypothetical protein
MPAELFAKNLSHALKTTDYMDSMLMHGVYKKPMPLLIRSEIMNRPGPFRFRPSPLFAIETAGTTGGLVDA